MPCLCSVCHRRLYSYQGIPLPVVRHLARQTLAALHFLHTKCQITHLGEPASDRQQGSRAAPRWHGSERLSVVSTVAQLFWGEVLVFLVRL